MKLQGAARHGFQERGNDLYETPAEATRALIKHVPLPLRIWEPAAGRGAIKRVLEAAGHEVHACDLVTYDGADEGIFGGFDFLAETIAPAPDCAIVTNPPYKLADQFIRHGLSLGVPVIVLLRLMAIEGRRRSDIIDSHLRSVWAGVERLPMMHREGWAGSKITTSGAPFAWFVFEPGERKGPIELHRISWRFA